LRRADFAHPALHLRIANPGGCDAYWPFHMDITHITSDSLRRILGLTEKKDQLISAIADVENQLVSVFEAVSAKTSEAVKSLAPAKAAKKSPKPAASKPAKKKRNISPEGRAKMAQAAKARWAARRAGKTAKVVVAPKAGKPAKVKKKSGLTPEGRAKPAAKVGKPVKKGFKLPKTA
jgi:hypothetical protein